ncbi:MAG: polyphosphate kinase 1 [Granulosicoccus sp.]
MNLHNSAAMGRLMEQLPLSRDNASLFINRELSWIKFNHRVLEEARRPSTPLLERVKFLGILSSNVDEFYMKRLGGLKQKIAAENENRSIDGMTPREQLEQCRVELRSLQLEKEQVCRQVRQELHQENIEICEYASLLKSEKASLEKYYREQVEPLITVCRIDPSFPFPFISNLSLYLLLSLKQDDDEKVKLALVKIPAGNGLSRFVQLDQTRRFVKLEDIVAAHLESILPQVTLLSIDAFRVTRNAVSYRDYSELDDLREIIEEELLDRRFASVVRLQVNPSMQPELRRSLAINLGLDNEGDIFESSEILRMSDFRELASLEIPLLRDDYHRPVISRMLISEPSILAAMRKRANIVLQHPYESFTHSIEGFVKEASEDPDVLSINMTLYRTSADTRIVDYLIAAAGHGKKVSVVVELKARFDEASNLQWARRLEKAGVHVSHGIANLKIHCKCILVVRKDDDGLRRYAHIGTGNYHAGTAQLYSDIGLLTCDDSLTKQISVLFKYLTSRIRHSKQLDEVMATPHTIKSVLLSKIYREIALHSEASPGSICMKTNALEDPDITLALYNASRAGVSIDLIVRDICRVRPGIQGVSENIRVISIVGRFLEHSRLYRFRNGGNEELFMGSADLMTRNLERRIELLVPVTDPLSRQLLSEVLNLQLRDNKCAWEMREDGSYIKRTCSHDETVIDSQTAADISLSDRMVQNRLHPDSGSSSMKETLARTLAHRVF